jgi:hypothetical protein
MRGRISRSNFAVFEPENTPEQRLIEGLQIQIEHNPHFWPILEQEYGNLGEIPGTDVLSSENFITYIICNTSTRR